MVGRCGGFWSRCNKPMKLPRPETLAKTLQHQFNDLALLEQALTHPSASSSSRPDNQRMEFLGDRVLGLAVARELMVAFPDAPEGELAPRFNDLVRRETLAEVAEEIGLGQFLHLGRSESISGGRRKAAILADAMEAVIAAIYMDGGMDRAEVFVLRYWQDRIRATKVAPTDPKTQVQEWAQTRGMPPPAYILVKRSGPDHAPVFLTEASLENGLSARGEAKSKKLAEQAAAADLLKAIAKHV